MWSPIKACRLSFVVLWLIVMRCSRYKCGPGKRFIHHFAVWLSADQLKYTLGRSASWTLLRTTCTQCSVQQPRTRRIHGQASFSKNSGGIAINGPPLRKTALHSCIPEYNQSYAPDLHVLVAQFPCPLPCRLPTTGTN